MARGQRILLLHLPFPAAVIGALLGVATTLPLMMAAWIRARSLGETFIL